MSIYEIDDAITSLVDMETGEIEDEKRYDELQMERTQKVENIGCFYKNLVAEAKAMREEESNLAQRRKAVENKAERIKSLLAYALKGEKFESAKVRCSYRKAKSVHVYDGFVAWAEEHADDLLTYKEPVPNRTAIKAALADGRDVEHAEIVTNESLQVK
nr:MAG TPA_asm: resistance protein [Caudoviricetes sp.]